MNNTFEGLPEEKRKLIIDVSMEEFAQNGYEKASTNAIVKKAGISKGILFHYFGNKKNLFLYIVDYAMDVFLEKFYSMDEQVPSDLFDKIIHWGLKKLKLYYELPLVSKLIMTAYIKIPDELKEEMMVRYRKIYNENLPLFFNDIDTTKFREGVDKEKAVELIMLCLEGLNGKYIQKFKSDPEAGIPQMDEIFNEMREYFEILKGGLYGSPQ